METNYFLIINGQQVGPLALDRLREAGLKGDTPVWRIGLSDWVMAATLPELEEVLSQPPNVAPGQYPQPDHFSRQGQYNPQGQYGPKEQYGAQGQYYPQGDYPPQGHYNPGNPYGQYGQPSDYNNGLPIAHTNWLPWAIVGTVLGVLCCFLGMIFGIIGIVNASKANRYYNEGNRMMGDAANSTARTNTIISLVLSGLGIPISIFVLSDALGQMQTLLNAM